MPVTFENRVNRAGIMKSSAPIDKSNDVLLHIPYSLVCKDGDVEVQDARVIDFDPADLSGPFKAYADITDKNFDTWIAAYEAKNIVDEDTGETALDVMKASLKEQLADRLSPVMVLAEEAKAAA